MAFKYFKYLSSSDILSFNLKLFNRFISSCDQLRQSWVDVTKKFTADQKEASLPYYYWLAVDQATVDGTAKDKKPPRVVAQAPDW